MFNRDRSRELESQLRAAEDKKARSEFFIKQLETAMDQMRAKLEVAEARAAVEDVLREEIQRLHEQVDSLLAHIVTLTTPQPMPMIQPAAPIFPMDEMAEDEQWLAAHNPQGTFDPNSPEVREIVEAAGLKEILDRTGALSSDITIAE